MGTIDERVLVYSGLFMCCAFISAIVGPGLGLAAFLPATVLVEGAYRWAVLPVNRFGE